MLQGETKKQDLDDDDIPIKELIRRKGEEEKKRKVMLISSKFFSCFSGT